VVISAATIAALVLLAHVVAGVVTDPASRTLSHWGWPLTELAVLWTVRTLAQWGSGRMAQRGASAAIADLGGQVLRSVTALPPAQLTQRRDDAAGLVTRGLDGLRPYFTAYLPTLFLAALLSPAALAVIALYDVQSAAIAVLTLPLIPLFMVLIGLTTAERSAAALAATTTLQARLLDLVAGIPTLRALGRARGPAARIAELAAAHRRSTMATLRIAFLSALVLELLATLGVAVIAVSIGMRLVYGELSLATGLTVLLLAPEVYGPLRRVGVEFHAAQDGKTAAERAFALIGPTPAPAGGTRTVNGRGAAIRVHGLGVAGRDGLRPDALDAVIQPGVLTVLTGPNGAGKSTTLQAIIGLVAPTSGWVTVAGIDVAELDPEQWWRQLAWLPQRPMLLPGTIAANLDLFGPLTDRQAACRTSGFDEVLDQLPDGLHTVVGRDGVGLSLGQRQRLALARTLGSAAPVLLLDEPTAHLDPATEARVLAGLAARARAGDTVIVVGHRDAVLDIADDVITVAGHDRVLV
jgi:ATP-binding cassette, subfamily C, bacterial CydD